MFIYLNQPLFIKQFFYKPQVLINQTVEKIDNDYLIKLSFKDFKNKPINDLFISIYDHDSPIARYKYSILKSNDKGEVDFNLPLGKYDAIITTDNKDQHNPDQFPFVLNYGFIVSKENSTNSIIELNKVIIKLNNFKEIPTFKVEASIKYKEGFRPSQMLTTNTINKKHIKFYASDEIYNFNLDTLEFKPNKTTTYCLAQKNLDLSSDQLIRFDFKKLKNIKVQIANTKYGWFKLISKNTGDFQSMYFDKPVDVYTNQDDLVLDKVYIPNPKCINYYLSLKNPTPSDIINICDDTNIRYDFDYIPIDYNNIFTIKPPNKIDIQINNELIKQGDLLTMFFPLINDDNYHLPQTSVHRLWEQPIRDTITFKNTNNKIIYKPNMFNQKRSSFYQEKMCLEPGKYKILIEKYLDVWGDNKKVSKELNITVIPGSQCKYSSDVPFSFVKFSSWQDLSMSKDSLNVHSTGNLITYPHFLKKNSPIDTKNIFTINSCQDLFRVNNETKTLIINIITNTAYDYDKQIEFSTCLSKFSQDNPQFDYVLKNNFLDSPFPTTKFYIFYFYYLQLHQNQNTFVGILANNFYDLFYGFQDFTLIDRNQFLKITTSKNNTDFVFTLHDWLENYGSITPSPVYILE